MYMDKCNTLTTQKIKKYTGFEIVNVWNVTPCIWSHVIDKMNIKVGFISDFYAR